jgi:2-amino-4-hydroxy-6-hydroxymethyldihydropteridine diphosphokinase
MPRRLKHQANQRVPQMGLSQRAGQPRPSVAVAAAQARAARVVTQAQLRAVRAHLAAKPVVRPAISAYLALGANLGEAQATVRWAMAAIAAMPGCELGACSSLYRTAPVDSSGPDYINAVVEVKTTLSAPDLLAQLHGLEQQAGRERPYRNAPRTLDLDILLYGSAHVHSPRLTIPHPRMLERAFVLVPLAEIAPGRVSVAQLRVVAEQACQRL